MAAPRGALGAVPPQPEKLLIINAYFWVWIFLKTFFFFVQSTKITTLVPRKQSLWSRPWSNLTYLVAQSLGSAAFMGTSVCLKYKITFFLFFTNHLLSIGTYFGPSPLRLLSMVALKIPLVEAIFLASGVSFLILQKNSH